MSKFVDCKCLKAFFVLIIDPQRGKTLHLLARDVEALVILKNYLIWAYSLVS